MDTTPIELSPGTSLIDVALQKMKHAIAVSYTHLTLPTILLV